MKYKFISIYGPTASGKTSFSIHLAELINGIIINFDSCQFNNFLPTITMSPKLEEKKNISHYLFDFLEVEENFSVKNFINKFQEVNNLSNKNKILVGGSGFYLFCLLKGLGNYKEISSSIENQVENNSKEENWKLLKQLDPSVEQILHINDIYRVKNYLKFFLQYNCSIQSINYVPIIQPEEIFNIFICPTKETLHNNINLRTNLYFDKMVEECEIFNKHLNEKKIIMNKKIIGYKYITDYIAKKITRNETIDLINQQTRQYAKNQNTFLKKKINANLIIEDPVNFNLDILINLLGLKK